MKRLVWLHPLYARPDHLPPEIQREIEREADQRCVIDPRFWSGFLNLFFAFLPSARFLLRPHGDWDLFAIVAFVVWNGGAWWLTWKLWARIWQRHAKSALQRHSLCSECGYDVRSHSGHCPECGWTVTPPAGREY
jgi:hypothetical protein